MVHQVLKNLHYRRDCRSVGYNSEKLRIHLSFVSRIIKSTRNETPTQRRITIFEPSTTPVHQSSKNAILPATSKSQQAQVYKRMQEGLSTENHALLDSDDLSISVWLSFAEVYNEALYDLLGNCRNMTSRDQLKLRKHQAVVYIKEFSSVNLENGTTYLPI